MLAIFSHQYLTSFGRAFPIGCVKPGEHVSPERLQSTYSEIPEFGDFLEMQLALGLVFLYA